MFKVHNTQARINAVQTEGVAGLLATPPEPSAVEAYRAQWRAKAAEAEAQAADFKDRLSKAVAYQQTRALHLAPVANLLANAADAIRLARVAGADARAAVPECCTPGDEDMLALMQTHLRELTAGVAAAMEETENGAAVLARCK